jgi:NTP pyrophosphatase (non-canonical NTP hydrolase)
MTELPLNSYQTLALQLAMYPGQHSFMGACYCALKLNGEAGEVAEKIGKAWRDNNGKIDHTISKNIALELGDVLWYIAGLADELDYSLEEIALLNLAKLEDRRRRGVLSGSGDSR